MAEQEADASSSPILRFGKELARSRRTKGWSQAELGRRMGFSNTYVSYVERGKRSPTPNFAVKADQVFGLPGVFDQLWRNVTHAALLEGFPEFAEAEARSHQIRTFEMGVMPGLFQTERYAQALANAASERGSITPEQAAERVAFLMARQQRLTDPKPPRMHAVLDHSCLARPVGGREVMAEQLRHLEALAVMPHVTIQVAPFSIGEHIPFTMPVVLLTLPDRSVVGYAESQLSGHLDRTREAVAALVRDYDQLLVEALDKRSSLEMIRAAREELE